MCKGYIHKCCSHLTIKESWGKKIDIPSVIICYRDFGGMIIFILRRVQFYFVNSLIAFGNYFVLTIKVYDNAPLDISFVGTYVGGVKCVSGVCLCRCEGKIIILLFATKTTCVT